MHFPESVKDMIMARSITQTSGCREWLGPFAKKDHAPILKIGNIQINPRTVLFKFRFPAIIAKKVFNVCGNPKCIAPEHSSAQKKVPAITEKLSVFVEVAGILLTPCHLLPNHTARNTYPKFSLLGKTMYAHREMYELHHGPIPPRMQVHHECNDKRCFNIEHLALKTPKENIAKAKADGLLTGAKTSGEKHGNCKANNGAVIDMRLLKSQGSRRKDIAKKYGVHTSYVTNIIAGHLRKDVRLLNTSKLSVSLDISIEEEGKATKEESFTNERQEMRIISDRNSTEIYAQNFDGVGWSHMKDAEWTWIKEVCKTSKFFQEVGCMEALFA